MEIELVTINGILDIFRAGRVREKNLHSSFESFLHLLFEFRSGAVHRGVDPGFDGEKHAVIREFLQFVVFVEMRRVGTFTFKHLLNEFLVCHLGIGFRDDLVEELSADRIRLEII